MRRNGRSLTCTSMKLGVAKADIKRSCKLIWGRRVARNLGIYAEVSPVATDCDVETKPRFMDLAKKRSKVSETIKFIKMYDSDHVQMYDWSEYDEQHTCISLLNSILIICNLPEVTHIKIGVTTCVQWRMVACQGCGPNGSMQAHIHSGWNHCFVLAMEYGEVAAFMETQAIADLRALNCKKLCNIRDGGDGTIRDLAPMYIYVAAKVKSAGGLG